jgi:hypothetical protein
MTPAQTVALVFGIVYLLFGFIGFAVTGFSEFAGQTYDRQLLIFALNPLHNIVHLAIGAVWLVSSSKHPSARRMNLIVGVVYALVTALGMGGLLKFLAISGWGAADNFLHLFTAIIGVYFGTAGAMGPRSSPTSLGT